jgi:hypothetical protein
MRGFVLLACAVSALTVLAFTARPSHAAAIINVSPGGTDNGSCGASGTPCKTLQGAINRAAAEDTVKLQQAGDYGPATIDKSINILGVQGAGVFSPAGGPCVTVTATVSNVVVIITEFTCDMGGTFDFDGIKFNSGDSLFLSKVVVRGGSGDTCGVFFQPNAASFLTMTDTTVTAFRGEQQDNAGVCVTPRAGGDATATLQRVNLSANDVGLSSTATATSTSNVTIIDSIIGDYFVGIDSSGSHSRVFVRHCVVAMNPKGLVARSGGQIISLGDNTVVGNNSNESFTSTDATE